MRTLQRPTGPGRGSVSTAASRSNAWPASVSSRSVPAVHAHRHVPFASRDVLNPDRSRVAAVGQHVVARPDRELLERLAGAAPLRRGQLEEIAAERRQVDAVVKAPHRPGPAGLAHGRRIERPHLEAGVLGNRDPMLPEQFHAEGVKPFAGFPQPLEQGHVGQIGQARLPSPYHGFAQGMPAAKMDQQGPQQVFRRLVLAQALQGSGRGRQIQPIGWEKRHQQVPVLIRSRFYYRLGHAHTIQDSGQAIKLALMGRSPHFTLSGPYTIRPPNRIGTQKSRRQESRPSSRRQESRLARWAIRNRPS